jgi:succinyl-diaminopimelate desuccinylase
VSGDEQHLADRLEATLQTASHLEVIRHGNTVAARTALGHDTRVIIAGHIDTVPHGGVGPVRLADGRLHGRGSVDMKSAVASQLILAAQLDAPRVDVTWMFYDQEEVDADRNGLGHFHSAHPEWFVADAAVLGEPSLGGVEGGCNGTMRADIRRHGVAAHSARPWRGDNAIHQLAAPLGILAAYEPETRVVEGLAYRESLNAVKVHGGIAGNVIPDSATLTVNYRFAPDRSVEQAEEFLREMFPGSELVVVDQSPGARPGLDIPIVEALVAASGREVGPKYGWTDVARFSQLGIPAVNFGPGDGGLAHSDDESVEVSEIEHTHQVLHNWLNS